MGDRSGEENIYKHRQYESDELFTSNVEEWEWDCGTFPDITQGPYDQNVTDGGTEHVDKGGNETENLNVDKGSELDQVMRKLSGLVLGKPVDKVEADSTMGPEIVSDTESEDLASSDGFRSLEGSSDEHRWSKGLESSNL
ncbi:hypothetical protein Acr_02g0004310 [Actinidia rufa]|uniref:Uncharacterized protein n=1 Tax=Actinidia rufa TaxID=165716 RepID=A0A7J0E6R9_9ERIC|nr:hypothetical protein Acr_02g0004310 [Actinidia rufa]